MQYTRISKTLWRSRFVEIIFNHVVVLYCYGASRTENTMQYCVRINPPNHLGENAPLIFRIKSLVFQHSTSPHHLVSSQLFINYKFKFVNLAEPNLFIVYRHEQADGNDGFLQSFHIPGKSVHLYSLQVKHFRTVTVTVIRYYSAKVSVLVE
jgi:hypothetical protein